MLTLLPPQCHVGCAAPAELLQVIVLTLAIAAHRRSGPGSSVVSAARMVVPADGGGGDLLLLVVLVLMLGPLRRDRGALTRVLVFFGISQVCNYQPLRYK